MSADESYKLPDDFNINATIPILREQLKKIPLTEYFHNLILREEKKEPEKTEVRSYSISVYYVSCYNATILYAL